MTFDVIAVNSETRFPDSEVQWNVVSSTIADWFTAVAVGKQTKHCWFCNNDVLLSNFIAIGRVVKML